MRNVEQYFLISGDGSGTLASGTANVELSIQYQQSRYADTISSYEAPDNGEATIALLLTAASGTTSCTVSAKNLYGATLEGDYWTVATVTATTSGVSSVTLLHITKSQNYDPNATGIKIKIARGDAVDLTYSGRLIRA